MTLKKDTLAYLVKFIAFFCILYFGTAAIIGLSSPGGKYNSFIATYFNYASWLRASLLHGAKKILNLAGYDNVEYGKYTLRFINGRGIHMVYSCLGYGIMSFWTAFILANKSSWKKKLKWIIGGNITIWCINVLRVTFLLISINERKSFFRVNHHTLFNIAAYIAIFILMFFFDRSQKKDLNSSQA